MVKESDGSQGEELRAVRDEKGLSRQRAVEFFRRHGYDFSTRSLQNWESGEREPRDVDLNDLTKLLKGYQKHTSQEGPDNQQEGENYDLLPDSSEFRSRSNLRTAHDTDVCDTATEYRFYGRNFGTENEPVPSVFEKTVVVSDRIIRAQLGRLPDPDVVYWTCVNGESMEPFLQDGTPILVEETNGSIGAPGRYVLYLNAVGGIVKRCEKLGEDTLRVVSDNPSFQTQVLTHRNNDLYNDRNGRSVKLCTQGRVIYPKDTACMIGDQAPRDGSRVAGSWQDKESGTE